MANHDLDASWLFHGPDLADFFSDVLAPPGAPLSLELAACEHLNEDGAIEDNEDGGSSLLESCTAAVTITVTPVPLGILQGQNLALSPATILITESALGRTATRSVAVSPATVTVTAQVQVRTLGALTRALSPATVTTTPVALARTLGGASRAVTPATITITPIGNGISNTGGASQNLAMLPATISVTESALGRSSGGVSRALAPATVTVTPVVQVRAAANALGLSRATVTITPSTLARTSGAISRAMSPATITIAAQTFVAVISNDKILALDPAVVTVFAAQLVLSAERVVVVFGIPPGPDNFHEAVRAMNIMGRV